MNESFNKAALNYDDTFTHSDIGKLQRQRVYYWLNKTNFFKQNNSVFEINCGTGYDADIFNAKGLNIIATDASSKMIEVSKKARHHNIEFFQLDFNNIEDGYKNSDVVFSNFGGLNCLNNKDLKLFSENMARLQKSKESLVWIIMPKFCMVETMYLISKFKFSQVFRRNTNDGIKVDVDGVKVETYYHSPKDLKTVLKPNYNIKLIKPVAYFLPPSYLEPFFKKHQKALRFLNKLDQFFSRFSFLSAWSDHYIIIAERK